MNTRQRQLLLITFVCFLGSSAVRAQSSQTPNILKLEPGTSPAKAKVADLAWLKGRWVGEGLGGACEEEWMPPGAGSMLGMFRMIKDDKLVFSEYMMLTESAGSVVLKIKHFGPDFIGWEEKDGHVTFKLIKATDRELNFDGMTIRKTDSGLKFFVAMKSKGKVEEAEFNFKPAKS